MSTSAGIGMVMPDGSVKAIHLHWDGYPGSAGAILGGWYKTPERLEQLLALGDISSLGTKLEPDPEKEHNKYNYQEDVVLAYHRDYRERMVAPRIFTDKAAYELNGKSVFSADFLYLFEDGKWYVKGIYHTEGWIELTVEICKQN